MRMEARVPGPPLDRFVALLWEAAGSSGPHTHERVLPAGTVEVILNLREDEIRTYPGRDPLAPATLPGAIVCGARTEHFVIDADPETHVLGVHFHPGGAFPFFGLPADELRNQDVALECLWGRARTRELRERLLAARDAEARFDLLESVLARRAADYDPHPAVRFALRELAALRPVGAVAERTGFSARRLGDLFRREVGVTPKAYARIRRFQDALARAGRDPGLDWTEVAHQSGYFDQAHFNHDFRAFSGLTPSEYSERRTRHMNHVRID